MKILSEVFCISLDQKSIHWTSGHPDLWLWLGTCCGATDLFLSNFWIFLNYSLNIIVLYFKGLWIQLPHIDVKVKLSHSNQLDGSRLGKIKVTSFNFIYLLSFKVCQTYFCPISGLKNPKITKSTFFLKPRKKRWAEVTVRKITVK